MIASSIAYIAGDGNPVPRVQQYRNRTGDFLKESDVAISANGNIVHRPISKLDCFANPIEYYRGESDQPRTFNNGLQVIREPRWYALCPSRRTCGIFSLKRVEGDPAVKAKYDDWESATKRLPQLDRIEHPTFTAFAEACNDRDWKSNNTVSLAAKRAQRDKLKRRETAEKKRKAKVAAPLSIAALTASKAERDQRQAVLVAAAGAPGAPSLVRNLSDASIEFTCDVWQVLDALKRRSGGEITGGDVKRAMTDVGLDRGKASQSLHVRINEAIKRIQRLEDEHDNAPVWGGFAQPTTKKTVFSNGVVFELFDDD